jgi:hypothetical protein
MEAGMMQVEGRLRDLEESAIIDEAGSEKSRKTIAIKRNERGEETWKRRVIDGDRGKRGTKMTGGARQWSDTIGE